MELKIVHGYYKDLKQCEEIMKGSPLYDAYFNKKDGVKDYIKLYYPDEGRGNLFFAETKEKEKVGLMVINDRGFIREFDYLALLGVKEGYRDKGVGTFLLNSFVERCRANGCPKASLLVSDFNTAFDFYKKNGFYRCGVVPNALLDGIHEFIMLKDLQRQAAS